MKKDTIKTTDETPLTLPDGDTVTLSTLTKAELTTLVHKLSDILNNTEHALAGQLKRAEAAEQAADDMSANNDHIVQRNAQMRRDVTQACRTFGITQYSHLWPETLTFSNHQAVGGATQVGQVSLNERDQAVLRCLTHVIQLTERHG